jgi:hypothetical protein
VAETARASAAADTFNDYTGAAAIGAWLLGALGFQLAAAVTDWAHVLAAAGRTWFGFVAGIEFWIGVGAHGGLAKKIRRPFWHA